MNNLNGMAETRRIAGDGPTKLPISPTFCISWPMRPSPVVQILTFLKVPSVLRERSVEACSFGGECDDRTNRDASYFIFLNFRFLNSIVAPSPLRPMYPFETSQK